MAAQTLTAEMTDEEFERHALSVLSRELGLADYARYLRLCRSGRGDYTAERHKWQAGVTLEDIKLKIEKQARIRRLSHRETSSSSSSAPTTK
jgi:hypothetical protein